MELDRDAFKRPLPAGWKKPLPEHVPRRTYWPAILALAATLALLGVVTLMPISVIGTALGAVALIGWIGEILHE
jgi:hypothetical protein